MLVSFGLNGATLILYIQSDCREKSIDAKAFIVYWILAAVQGALMLITLIRHVRAFKDTQVSLTNNLYYQQIFDDEIEFIPEARVLTRHDYW